MNWYWWAAIAVVAILIYNNQEELVTYKMERVTETCQGDSFNHRTETRGCTVSEANGDWIDNHEAVQCWHTNARRNRAPNGQYASGRVKGQRLTCVFLPGDTYTRITKVKQ